MWIGCGGLEELMVRAASGLAQETKVADGMGILALIYLNIPCLPQTQQ
jgi:hypothetical protein